MKKLKKAAAYILVVLFVFNCIVSPARAAITAIPTSSPVFVNGKLVAFQAYTIGESNYFKLRDIAMVLSGTAKQFDVEYHAVTNSIALHSNRAYTPVGGELAAPGGNAGITADYMTSKVSLDGAEINLAAYTINSNNYFKLRDIGAAIDFGVTWDAYSNSININSSIGYGKETAESMNYIVSDHTSIKLDRIPAKWIEKAKTDLHVVYGHTSHGSQIITGLLGLTNFKGSPYIYYNFVWPGTIDLRDNPFGDENPLDLGQPDNKTWAEKTRSYLKSNKDINVVMWAWCGQLSTADEVYVNRYFGLMQELEAEFPNVTFVYMTGHLDGSGETGTLARNNGMIREFCKNNGKVLFDFADIESYNPDGVYFGDKLVNDACDYDSDGDNKTDKNWATIWQSEHKEGVDWYKCESAHSQPINANMKAYAAWWLWARLAGWDGNM